ncbi:hypothetical protein BGZ63DRAFT_408838 [Mariannaea sp. PMI_226]|nr:hypothetical protein BGZ63DRAFT_408838 [Mariannaea sp. PMI_226]
MVQITKILANLSMATTAVLAASVPAVEKTAAAPQTYNFQRDATDLSWTLTWFSGANCEADTWLGSADGGQSPNQCTEMGGGVQSYAFNGGGAFSLDTCTDADCQGPVCQGAGTGVSGCRQFNPQSFFIL